MGGGGDWRVSGEERQRENVSERVEWWEKGKNFFIGSQPRLFLGTWTDSSERGPSWSQREGS